MRFKNMVGENQQVLSDTTTLILSESELNKYNTSNLQQINVVNTSNMDFKVSEGKFGIIINSVKYNINVKEIQSEFFAVQVEVNNSVTFTIEKLREINKYDIIRSLVKNLGKIKEEV